MTSIIQHPDLEHLGQKQASQKFKEKLGADIQQRMTDKKKNTKHQKIKRTKRGINGYLQKYRYIAATCTACLCIALIGIGIFIQSKGELPNNNQPGNTAPLAERTEVEKKELALDKGTGEGAEKEALEEIIQISPKTKKVITQNSLENPPLQVEVERVEREEREEREETEETERLKEKRTRFTSQFRQEYQQKKLLVQAEKNRGDTEQSALSKAQNTRKSQFMSYKKPISRHKKDSKDNKDQKPNQIRPEQQKFQRSIGTNFF